MESSGESASQKMEVIQSSEKSGELDHLSAREVLDALELRGDPLENPGFVGQVKRHEYTIPLHTLKKIGPDFKKLKPRTCSVVRLYCAGLNLNVIATLVGLKPNTISQIIRDPLVRPLIDAVMEDIQQDTRVLFGRAVDVLRGVMIDGKDEHALTAANMVFKLNGKYDEPSKAETAEDVIKRMIEKRDGDKSITVTEEITTRRLVPKISED